MKGADEFDPRVLGPPGPVPARRLAFLVLPEARSAFLQRLGATPEGVRVVDFDPKRDKLASVVRDLEEQPEAPPHAGRPVLIAPYFLLKHDGICGDLRREAPACGETTFFANNFTLQQFKIKGAKALLNAVFALLALLPPADLADCPFLGRSEGIHVADLSYIPEKYRLDPGRAEKILKCGLGLWLDTVRESWEKGG